MLFPFDKASGVLVINGARTSDQQFPPAMDTHIFRGTQLLHQAVLYRVAVVVVLHHRQLTVCSFLFLNHLLVAAKAQ